MNPAWLFVLATVVAVFGILVAFKKMMRSIGDKLAQGQSLSIESIKKDQTKFFMQVAIAESVPILLIVFAFIQMESFTEQISLIIPLAITLIVVIIALMNVWATKRDVLGYETQSNETNNLVNTLCFIGIGLMLAFPIISIIGLFLL